jgi:hypothetical protein
MFIVRYISVFVLCYVVGVDVVESKTSQSGQVKAAVKAIQILSIYYTSAWLQRPLCNI